MIHSTAIPKIRSEVVSKIYIFPKQDQMEATIIQRFYWPGNRYAVWKEVTVYDTWKITKQSTTTNVKLTAKVEEETPLDTVFIDFWSPGDSVTDKSAAFKVLTYFSV